MKKFIPILLLLVNNLAYGQDKQQLLTVATMRADLSILKTAFNELHPGIYRYITPTQFNHYFEDIERQTDKPLSIATFYTKLSQLTTKLKCGHTYLNPYNQKKTLNSQLLSKPVIPLLFRVINKQFIVTHNLSDHAQINPGDQIVSINGISVKKIIDSLLTVSRSDGRHGLNKQLDNIGITPYLSSSERYALFDIYFPLFFPEGNHNSYFDVAVKAFNSKNLVHFRVGLISKPNRYKRYQDRFSKETKQPTGTFSWITPESGYLKIRDFSKGGWGKDYEQFLDSIFSKLAKLQTSKLIVDIRDNEGGDDDVRNKIISYLINKPLHYSVMRYFRFLSVSDELKPYLETWDPSFKKPKLASEYEKTKENLFYRKNSNPTDYILPNQNNFAGKVYLIINATNSSSSFFMADMLKENSSAKLVGEPTGGTKQGINGGQFFFLFLPGSGIEIDIPLIYQAPIKKRKDEGVQPDIRLETQPSGISKGLDIQLQYLISSISLMRN